MFYREIGQYKTTYAADQGIAPLWQDKWLITILIIGGALIAPLFMSNYWLGAILIPTLCFGLAALGTNILTGYAGQLTLGSAAFMAVGGFTTYNILIRFPDFPFPIAIIIAGLIAGLFGVLIGLPSLRIKGFYLIVATLLAHFFVQWLFDAYPWFKNYNPQGQVKTPALHMFGYTFTGRLELYYLVLAFVLPLTLLAKNMMRSTLGRNMMAVRDMDMAASVIGISVARTKILAFAISSFYCGVAGALYVYAYLQLLDTRTYSLEMAFALIFMIIIGGMGTIIGSYIGAAVIFLVPIMLNTVLGNYGVDAAQVSNITKMIFGVLVVAFLVLEPRGLICLFTNFRDRMRRWPLPY